MIFTVYSFFISPNLRYTPATYWSLLPLFFTEFGFIGFLGLALAYDPPLPSITQPATSPTIYRAQAAIWRAPAEFPATGSRWIWQIFHDATTQDRFDVDDWVYGVVWKICYELPEMRTLLDAAQRILSTTPQRGWVSVDDPLADYVRKVLLSYWRIIFYDDDTLKRRIFRGSVKSLLRQYKLPYSKTTDLCERAFHDVYRDAASAPSGYLANPGRIVIFRSESGLEDKHVYYVESVFMFTHDLVYARCTRTYIAAFVNLWHKLTGTSVLGSLSSSLQTYMLEFGVDISGTMPNIQFQSEGYALQLCDVVQDLFAKKQEVLESPLGKKFLPFLRYLMVSPLLVSMSIDRDDPVYLALEGIACSRFAKRFSTVGFLLALTDFVTFAYSSWHQSLSSPHSRIFAFLHGSTTYGEWYDRYHVLVQTRRGDEPPTDDDLFAVSKLVDDGTEIAARLFAKGDRMYATMDRMLKSSIVARDSVIRRIGGFRNRMCPFAICIEGPPAIGKTTIINLAAVAAAHAMELDPAPHYRYTVDPTSQFWDGFKSNMHTLLLDDIAQLIPAPGQVEKSIEALFRINSSVPFLTNQAFEDEKGKNYCLPHIVIATTNHGHDSTRWGDLCFRAIFNEVAAASRRLPYRIVPKVRPEFCKKSGDTTLKALDTELAAGHTDLWTFDIVQVITVDRESKFVPLFTEVSTGDFTKIVYDLARAHKENEQTMLDSRNEIDKMAMCSHGRLSGVCSDCFKIESTPYFLYFTLFVQWITLTLIYTVLFQVIEIVVWLSPYFGGMARRYFYLRYKLILVQQRLCMIKSKYYISKGVVFGSRIRQGLCEAGERVNALPAHIKALVIGMLAAVSGLAIANYAKTLFREPMEPQGGLASRHANEWVSKAEKYTPRFDLLKRQPPTKVHDPLHLIPLIQQATYIMRVDGKFCRALAIGGNKFLTVSHMLPDRLATYNITMTQGLTPIRETRTYPISPQHRMRLGKSDLLVLHLPTRSHADLTRYMGPLFPQESRVVGHGFFVNDEEDTAVVLTPTRQVYDPQGYVADGYKYKRSGTGLCGSTLIQELSPGLWSIVGLHVAGAVDQEEGICEQLARSLFENLNLGPGFPGIDLQGKTLGPLHVKSGIGGIDSGSGIVLGSLVDGHRSKRSSDVRSTIIDDGTSDRVPPPLKKGWYLLPNGDRVYHDPMTLGITPALQSKSCVPGDLLRKAARCYLDDIKSVGPPRAILTLHEAINGVPGAPYMKRINMRTSTGYPYNTVKTNMMVQDEATGDWAFGQELQDDCDRIEAIYERGECALPIFMASLKDEPVSKAKRDAGKARVFCGAPVAWCVLVRKYFLPILDLLRHNRLLCENAVGMNVASKEWHELYLYLIQYGIDRLIAGDYATFDKCMRPEAILCAFDVLIGLVAILPKSVRDPLGYTDKAIAIMKLIAQDVAFPVVNVDEALVWLMGSNPSGHPITVDINSIVNSLYVRCAFEDVTNIDMSLFRHFVALMVFGDDNVMNVSSRVDFDHTKLQTKLAEWGITYTMADKNAMSVPFLHISEVDFLKRRFRWDEDGSMRAPLAEASIRGSLNVCVASRAIPHQQQLLDIADSVCREWWHYGKDKYEIETELLGQRLSSLGFKPPRYESVEPRALLLSDSWDDDSGNFIPCFEPAVHQLSEGETGDGYRPESACDRDYRLSNNNNNSGDVNTETHDTTQSSTEQVTTYMESTQDDVFQNVGFQDDVGIHKVSFQQGTQEDILQFGEEDIHLGNFLKRPLRLGQHVIGSSGFRLSGVDYPLGIDPWVAFLKHPSIRPKIQNFRLIRGTLKLRFVTSGNPFYFGRDMICYEPFHRAAPSIASGITYSRQRLQFGNPWSGSQLPHVTIDPSTSCTCEIDLPFVWYYDWLDLNDLDAMTIEPTPVQSTKRPPLGILAPVRLAAFGTVGSAPPAQMPLVSVYAWFGDDVKLAMPTSYVAQAGSDEYGQGIVSKPASTVARIAGRLTDIPVIGRFARATEIGARAVSSIASLFGFSTPVNLAPHNPMMNQPYHNMSVTSRDVTVQKITFDPKQEVTIDGTAVGLGPEDDMRIMAVAGREGLLTILDWELGDASGETLGQVPVDPTTRNVIPQGLEQYFVVTPVGFICTLFQLWRGPLTFKFVFVCSAYHRGRIKIAWEPDEDAPSPDINTSNLIYTRVVDIAEVKELEYTVGWGQAAQYLSTEGAKTSNGYLKLSVLNPLQSPSDVADEHVKILVYVKAADGFQVRLGGNTYSTLMFGADTAPLLRETEEKESPKEDNGEEVLEKEVIYQAEAGDDSQSDGMMPANPQGASIHHYMTACHEDNGASDLVYTGEANVSLRNLVKRPVFFRRFYWRFPPPTGILADSAVMGRSVIQLPLYPFPCGITRSSGLAYNDTSSWGLVFRGPSNVVNNCLTTYVSLAYACVRGGTRYHLQLNTTNPTTIVKTTRANSPVIDVVTSQIVLDVENYESESVRAWKEMGYKFNRGYTLHNMQSQTGISVEVPYYHNKRFCIPNDGSGGNNVYEDDDVYTPKLEVRTEELFAYRLLGDAEVTARWYDVYAGASEDFSCHWFLGLPPFRTLTPT
jgi:hypothetical protein